MILQEEVRKNNLYFVKVSKKVIGRACGFVEEGANKKLFLTIAILNFKNQNEEEAKTISEKSISPIPLSNKILNKCKSLKKARVGETTKYEYTFKTKGQTVRINQKETIVTVRKEGVGNVIDTKKYFEIDVNGIKKTIKYVHQLQNIYYILKDKEIVIEFKENPFL